MAKPQQSLTGHRSPRAGWHPNVFRERRPERSQARVCASMLHNTRVHQTWNWRAGSAITKTHSISIVQPGCTKLATKPSEQLILKSKKLPTLSWVHFVSAIFYRCTSGTYCPQRKRTRARGACGEPTRTVGGEACSLHLTRLGEKARLGTLGLDESGLLPGNKFA
jgi:hypothetical protein